MPSIPCRPTSRGRTRHLADVFERNAERTLLVDARCGAEITYGGLMDQSRRVAAYLHDAGVRPGDAVVVSMDNCVELVTLYFACMQAGARIVPLGPSYHPRDHAALLGRLHARHLFTVPAVRARLDAVLAQCPDLRVHCLAPAGDRLKDNHRPLVNLDWASLSAFEPAPASLADAGDDDVFLTLFTSGSTGVPKGISIRHGALLGNGLAFCDRLSLSPDNRFFNVLPLTYLGGLFNLMLVPILAEGSFVLDSVFGPSNVFAFWERVREHQVNTLWFTPTMLSMLLARETDEDLGWVRSQVQLGLVGMAPLPVDLKRRFEERFGFPLYENYALSETTFVTTGRPGGRQRPGSVGTPLDGVQVQILGPDLRPLPAGHEGQIAVRTPYLMQGYDQDAGMPMHDGAFLTGDIGRLDGDGELYVTGRFKDVIIRGGVNISPKTIEDVLYGLEGVQEAAVVGVPHPVYGEEVALVVKVREAWRDRVTSEDVRRHCEANIAHFQRPKLIFFIDEVPKGATGKIHKTVLRKLLVEKLDPLNG